MFPLSRENSKILYLKNPAGSKVVRYAQTDLSFQFHRKKSNLDIKTCDAYPSANEFRLRQRPFQYVGLRLKPIHNYLFSIHPL